SRPVSIYSTLRNNISLGYVKTEKKKNLKPEQETENNSIMTMKYNIDFGIITALYEDEFNKIESFFIWNEELDMGTKIYKIGHPKSNPAKKVVAAVLTETGLVDAAVIATQMAELFKPKIIMMPGVCGGDIKTNIGDIIVAKSIFMFQKGKLSDIKNSKGELMKLINSKGEEFDPLDLEDEDGKQIILNVEKFEIEHSSICETDPVIIDKLRPKLKRIESKINSEIESYGKKVQVHFEPMACSSMVINKEGYFEKYVKPVDRKVIALEMESYGIARACQFANRGQTKVLIFKSVMDNMKDKEDINKSFAGQTSALFLKYLIEEDIF
ncbi:MAG: hypothetical protein ACN6OI_11420, partial [Flavobacterium sp.]|uniref:5'-methylthioadenosine/S-adenosylhomocysteine nucleosidase family protein n=1 Tax=Flavobacterium sp. TaxID=239 RepID=UPI003D0C787C